MWVIYPHHKHEWALSPQASLPRDLTNNNLISLRIHGITRLASYWHVACRSLDNPFLKREEVLVSALSWKTGRWGLSREPIVEGEILH
jgi:hypothetical protein